MDMSSGNWFSHHLGMGDQATTIHEHEMIMSSQSEAGGFNNNYYQPTTDLSYNRIGNNLALTQIDMSHNSNNPGGYFQPYSSSSSSGPGMGQDSNIMIATEVKPALDVLHSSSTNGWSSNGPFISFGTSQMLFDSNHNSSSFNVHQPASNHSIEFPVNYGDDDRGAYNIDLINNNLSHPKQRNKRFGGMSLCSQEHVLAERKRREIMTQRFLALSALIPGLNKTDKASILGDAAKYLKELEEQVKLLEEQTTQRRVECAVLTKTKRTRNPDDMLSSSSYENSNNNSTNPLLEIEARASNRNVLIRIHSQKDQGLVQKVLNEIEKLHLTTLNCHTMPFGGYAMNITIIAQMNDDLCMTVKDLVMHLRLALQQFLCYSQ